MSRASLAPSPQWAVPVIAAAATALAGAVALGWYVVVNQDLFHLEARAGAFALLAGVVVTGLLVLHSPDVALVCLLGVVYLNLSDALIRSFELPSVLQLLAVPLLLSGWSHSASGGLEHVLRRPLTWLAVAYLMVVLASTTWSVQPELADARVVEIAKALAVSMMVVLLVDSRERVRLAAWTLLLAGALLGLLGIVRLVAGVDEQVLAGLARSSRGQIYSDVLGARLTGPLGDANFFAQILVMVVPLGLHLVWTERRRPARLAAMACLALIGAALVLTYSRGGALVLGFVIVASLVTHGVEWRRILGGALAVLLAAIVLLPGGFVRRLATISELFSSDETYVDLDSSFEQRRLWVGTAWEMFVQNPALGVGAGNYAVRFAQYAERRGFTAHEYTDPDAVRYPHNLYLEVAAETGALGLAAFVAVLAAVFLTLERARGAFRSYGDETMSGFARALELAVVAYLMSSLFLHGHYQRYLWLLIGLAGALGVIAPLMSGVNRPERRRSTR